MDKQATILDDIELPSEDMTLPPLESLKQVLMRRDGMTSSEADAAIAEARELVEAGEDPEDVLEDEFGLEPDYIWDLIEGIAP